MQNEKWIDHKRGAFKELKKTMEESNWKERQYACLFTRTGSRREWGPVRRKGRRAETNQLESGFC
jgi:hypothetical protein